jgi:hypothetical protein
VRLDRGEVVFRRHVLDDVGEISPSSVSVVFLAAICSKCITERGE